MIKGTGTDIVDIESFTKIKNDGDFINQILTLDEISDLTSENLCENYIATIFAIKEAVLKAFGWGLMFGSYWHDINVGKDLQVSLTGKLKIRADEIQVSKIHSSYSPSKKYITAFVLLEG
jgi:phosphopantetheine--protein transferase-like protein